MEIQIFASADEMAKHVANLLSMKLSENGNVGFATGRTMDPVYEHLKVNPPKQIKAHAWMLDEYLGITQNDPRSYAAYLEERVFSPLSFPKNQIHLPRLTEMSAVQAAQDYEDSLRAAGAPGIQLLGIGHNGHVGLNEPGSNKYSRTRVVKIAEQTRVANQSLFASLSEVPTEALTLGVGTLLEAKELWLLAIGSGKADIIKRFVEGESSEEVPATLLKSHKGLKVFLDKEAAAKLS